MTPRNFSARVAVTGMIAGLVAATLPALTSPSAHAAPAQAAPATRPTEDIFKGPEASPVCRGDVCVHYAQDGTNNVPAEDDGTAGAWKGSAGNGVPDYVDLISASLVPKTVKVFADAGYRAPLDDGTAGGGDQLDIYLADLDDVAGGAYCTKEPVGETYTAAGFCVLDNNYSTAEYGTKISRAAHLGLGVAHHYSLVVTWAYHVMSRYNEDALWLDEATATWVEEEMYPTLNRNRAYLPYGPIGKPGTPMGGRRLQATVDGRGVTSNAASGAWIFLQYLGQRFPAAEGILPVVVRQWWESFATFGPQQPYFSGDEEEDALEPVLEARGTSVMDEYTRFSAIWNRDPARHYADGATYRPSPNRATTTLSSTRRTIEHEGMIGATSSLTFRFRPGSTLTGSWRLNLVLNGGGWTNTKFVVTFKAKNRAGVTRVLPADVDSVSLAFGSSVERVDITFVGGIHTDPGDILDPGDTYYDIRARVSRG